MNKPTRSDVGVSRSYSIFYWVNALLLTTIIAALTAGIGVFLFPIVVWYKLAVINRTKVMFEDSTNMLIFQRGRWFVKDDDIVPVKAIDNVKLNRSILGKIFGWCDISIETRSEVYSIKYVSTRQAERFRLAFLEKV